VQQRQQISGSHIVIRLAVALASTFMACGFQTPGLDMSTPEGVQAILNTAPYTALTESNRWTVAAIAGKLRVQHGYGCAQAPQAATEEYVGFRIQDMATVPRDDVDAGTVFLNGWRVQYAQEGTALTFVHQNGWDDGNDTAVRNLPGAFTAPGDGPRMVLPRGFGLTWPGTDHHVLQTGFDLGTQVISGNTITWTARTLLKDNDTRRNYHGAALVSVLSGQSVRFWQPATVLKDYAGGWMPWSNIVPLTPVGRQEAAVLGSARIP
jgi:hypothetical protein